MYSRQPISGPEQSGGGESWGGVGGYTDWMSALLHGGLDNSAVSAMLGGAETLGSTPAPLTQAEQISAYALQQRDPSGNLIERTMSATFEGYKSFEEQFNNRMAETGAWSDMAVDPALYNDVDNMNRYNNLPNETMHDGKVRAYSWTENSDGQLVLNDQAAAYTRDASGNVVLDPDGDTGFSKTWWEHQFASEVNGVRPDGSPADFQYSMGFEDRVTGRLTTPEWAEGLDLSAGASAGASDTAAPVSTDAPEQLVLPGFEEALGLSSAEPEQLVLPGFEDLMGAPAGDGDAPVMSDSPLADTVLADSAVDGASPTAETSTEPTTAGAPRQSYGSVALLGGATEALVTLGVDLYKISQGEEMSAGDVATDVGVAGVRGAGTSVVTEALARSLGGTVGADIGAGGIVSAVTAGLTSTWNNADAYQSGDVSAADATANVLVDTGIGLSAGLAGAAAGAAIGSIIPGAGTLIGGAIGFVAGTLGSMLASTAVTTVAQESGFTDWAKDGLGDLLGGAEEPLSAVWDNVGAAQDAISTGLSDAWSWLTGGSSDNDGEAAASAEQADPTQVSEALQSDDSPDMCTLVDSSSALDASELVGDAGALDNPSYDALMGAVGPQDIADVAADMDPAELSDAAASPEAADIARDLPEGTEKKVKEATAI